MEKNQLDETVKLTIDGEEVEARKGATVLEACEEAGFFIPTLCSDADLKPYGACRLCVVEIEGVRGLPTACTTPVAAGMKVRTDSPGLQKVRITAIQLIRSNHPTDCDACPRNQQCDLQMTEALLGSGKPRFRTIPKDVPVDRSNPFFTVDRNYCVLCGKCVRSCDEIRGVEALNFSNRGLSTKVCAGLDTLLVSSTCESCGECLDHCPVYALSPKETRKPSKETESTCAYCGVGCGLTLGVRQDEVVTSKGKKEGSVNRGSLCVKGRFGISEFVHSRERLTTPLIRRNGELTKATWEEALDLVSKRLASYRGDEMAVVASAKCTNEDNYVAQKFARVALGTNNIDNSARWHMAPSIDGLTRAFGIGAMTNSIEELTGSSCIMAIESDVTVTHPIVGLKIKRAVRNSAKLIVINPREIDLVRFASLWLRPRLGTDVALLAGIMKVIVDERLFDTSFVSERCKNFDAFKESLRDFSVAEVESLTGVPAAQVVDAARLFAKGHPASIVYGTEFIRCTDGTAGVDGVADLAMLTGNVGKRSSGINPLVAQNNAQGACDVGAVPDSLPGYQSADDTAVRAKFEAAWGCSLGLPAGLQLDRILDAASKKQIKAAYVIGSNPVLGEPDSNRVKEAFSALEFLVVQDLFLSETARLAEVVLPASSFAEKDGTFANTERRVQRVRRSVPAVGESRADWLITCQIAGKMGKKGFAFDSPSKIMQEIASLSPIYGGISYDRLEQSGLQWPCVDKQSEGTEVLHADGFASGAGAFAPVKYEPPQNITDSTNTLALVLGRTLFQSETGTLARKVNGLNALRGNDVVQLNPEDASALTVADGDRVKVISRHGEIAAVAKVTRHTAKGTAFMVFPFAGERTSLLDGPAIDPAYGIPKAAVCAVKIEISK
jgi:formate dehydrogenase alpha subunit